MSTTTIHTTCHGCHLTFELPATAIVLVLAGPSADADAMPSLMHKCPGCLAGDYTFITWRIAAYLLDAGASAVTAPDIERNRPRYPERRPNSRRPMSLDDLIDLHAVLEGNTRFPKRSQ